MRPRHLCFEFSVGKSLVFRRAGLQWRGLQASGGCQSPDLFQMTRKSGHLRTPLAEQILLVHAIGDQPGGSVVSAGERQAVQPEGPLDFQIRNHLQQLLMSQQ